MFVSVKYTCTVLYLAPSDEVEEVLQGVQSTFCWDECVPRENMDESRKNMKEIAQHNFAAAVFIK